MNEEQMEKLKGMRERFSRSQFGRNQFDAWFGRHAALFGEEREGNLLAPREVDGVLQMDVYAPLGYGNFFEEQIGPHNLSEVLREYPKDIPLQFYMDSPGGDILAVRAMNAILDRHQGPLSWNIDGLAASAAVNMMIASGGKRHAAKGSRVMIHKSWNITVGNADEHRATAEMLDDFDEDAASDMAAVGKKTKNEYLKMMAAETWMTPKQAKEAGLVDSIGTAAKAAPDAKGEIERKDEDELPVKEEERKTDFRSELELRHAYAKALAATRESMV